MSVHPGFVSTARQAGTVAATAAGFWLIAQASRGIASFLLGMAWYWAILAAQLAVVHRGAAGRRALRGLFGPPRPAGWAWLCFVPAALVFCAAFAPTLPAVRPGYLALALAVGLANGLLEESYWRGDVLRVPGVAFALVGTLLFAANHGAFLFFDLRYQGGAPNLVGGPLVMGALWALAARKSGSLRYGAVAHQLVNALAFYSLFVTQGAGQ